MTRFKKNPSSLLLTLLFASTLALPNAMAAQSNEHKNVFRFGGERVDGTLVITAGGDGISQSIDSDNEALEPSASVIDSFNSLTDDIALIDTGHACGVSIQPNLVVYSHGTYTCTLSQLDGNGQVKSYNFSVGNNFDISFQVYMDGGNPIAGYYYAFARMSGGLISWTHHRDLGSSITTPLGKLTINSYAQNTYRIVKEGAVLSLYVNNELKQQGNYEFSGSLVSNFELAANSALVNLKNINIVISE